MSDQSQNRTTDRNLSGAPDNGPLSAREAAELLGLAERTIRRAVGAGVLAATKRAGVYRIEPEELARYQRQRGRGRDVSSDHIHPRPTYLIALPGGRQRSASILPRSLVPMIGRQ
ncbi:MAG: helix-turn-helix domain-containing protein, partial [Chloroflexia bacterium]|nr:helix-turn-helix domain-containing protein [Chloroflexia bacterium]